MKVLIIKTGALGDVLRTTLLLPALRRLSPEVEITWITSSAARPLLEHNPHLDRLFLVDDASGAWRKEFYDWVLSLDDELDLCRLAASLKTRRLSGAYVEAGSLPCYSEDVAEWFGMGLLRPENEGGLARANELKRANQNSYGTILHRCLKLPLPVARPQIFVPAETRRQVQQWIAGTPLAAFPRLVGINTGAGRRWKYKSWGEEQTAALATELCRKFDVGVVILGGEQERERNERIKLMTGENCVVAPGDWDLLHFAAVVGLCQVVLTSDSLALHLAVANHVPAVAFFGPTSAAEIDLFGHGIKVVTDLSCRCCYLASCEVRPHCMESIGIETMLAAVTPWLS